MLVFIIGMVFLILAIISILLGDIHNINDLVMFYSNLILANIWFASNNN